MEYLKKYKWILIIVGLLLLGSLFSSQRTLNKTLSRVDHHGYGEYEEAIPVDTFGLQASPRALIAEPPFEPPTAGKTAADVDQKIIKTGSVDMNVRSVDETIESVTRLANEADGFVQHSSINQYDDGARYGSMTIRIPIDAFNGTLQSVKELAELVTNETTNGQDVTEQFTDLQARLRNAQAQERTYISLLDRAVNVQDVLSVQRELGNIRGQIESFQGRIQYLENQTSLSTIHLNLTQESTIKLPTSSFRPWQTVKDATASLVQTFQDLIESIIWFVIVGGGVIVPLGLIAWAISKIIRRRRR